VATETFNESMSPGMGIIRWPSRRGISAYNAATLHGIDAEFLYFPDKNHWVLKPQNGVLWQRRFYNWLDQYLK
jgi:hypothetical protein